MHTAQREGGKLWTMYIATSSMGLHYLYPTWAYITSTPLGAVWSHLPVSDSSTQTTHLHRQTHYYQSRTNLARGGLLSNCRTASITQTGLYLRMPTSKPTPPLYCFTSNAAWTMSPPQNKSVCFLTKSCGWPRRSDFYEKHATPLFELVTCTSTVPPERTWWRALRMPRQPTNLQPEPQHKKKKKNPEELIIDFRKKQDKHSPLYINREKVGESQVSNSFEHTSKKKPFMDYKHHCNR